MDVILVPGFWLDATSWDGVTPALVDAGHRVHALTLPGMESVDADRSGVTFDDHVAATVAAIDAVVGEGAAQVVLVGHSGGGAIIGAAADRRPDRVARSIFVDSGPLSDGGCINDELPEEDGEIPLPDWGAFEDSDLTDLDDALRTQFRARAIPQPLHVAVDPVQLTDERRHAIPATVIASSMPGDLLRQFMAGDHPYTRELGRTAEVEFVDVPTGHWPQFTKPAELGSALVAAIR